MNKQIATLAILLVGHFGLNAAIGAEPPAKSATVFAPTCFWYTPLPAAVPLHPNSANFVAEFVRQKKAYYGSVNINLTAYASPVYVADANSATVRVTKWDCQKNGFSDPNLTEQWKAVPIPAYAEPADGTDAGNDGVSTFSDTLWEFWQARKINGQWQACWGGSMRNVSKEPGHLAAPLRYDSHRLAVPGWADHGGGIAAWRDPARDGHCFSSTPRSGRSIPIQRIARTVGTRRMLPIGFLKVCDSVSILESMWMP